MAFGARKPETLADWDPATFTTAPPEDLAHATPADLAALFDADPFGLVEGGGLAAGVPEPSASGGKYADESGKLYVGKAFTLDQFREWWKAQSFGTMPYNGVGVHHTAIPDRHTWTGLQHLHNTFAYYANELGWPRGVGPHLWLRSARAGKVPGPVVYVGTHPAHDGIGISYRNHRYLHIEFIDRFTHYGMTAEDLSLWRSVLGIACGERGIPLKHCSGAGFDGPGRPMDGYLFHRRAKTDIKDCPGAKVLEPALDREMQRGRPAPVKPAPVKPAPVKPAPVKPVPIKPAPPAAGRPELVYAVAWARADVMVANAAVAALKAAGFPKAYSMVTLGDVSQASEKALAQPDRPALVIGGPTVPRLHPDAREAFEGGRHERLLNCVGATLSETADMVAWRLGALAATIGADKARLLETYRANLAKSSPAKPKPGVDLSRYVPSKAFGLTPHADKVRQHIEEKFKVVWIEGWVGDPQRPDHNGGRGVDFGTSFRGQADNKALGDAIARYLIDNREVLGVRGLIWWERQMGYEEWGYSDWSGWKPQWWRPAPNPNYDLYHHRHVHALFAA